MQSWKNAKCTKHTKFWKEFLMSALLLGEENCTENAWERERRCVYTLRLSVKFMIKELIVEHFTIEESSHKIVSFWKTLPWIHNTIFSQFLSSLVWRSCQKLAVKHYIWFRGWIEIQIFVYFQCRTTFNAFRSTLLIINFPPKNVFTTFWCCFYKRSHNFHPLGFSLKLTVLLTQTWNF